MTYEEQYLMHHGIKGQQWGVQNGPPYPLRRDALNNALKAASKDYENTGYSKKDYKEDKKQLKNYKKDFRKNEINDVKILKNADNDVISELIREEFLKSNINDDDIKRIKNALSNFEKADLKLAELDKGNGKITNEIKKASEHRDNAYDELQNITKELENKKLGDNRDTLLYMALENRIPEKYADTSKKERIRKILKEEQYLMHHGIKGQQWGVQNGPPYPLDSSISDGTKLTKKQQKANAEFANKDREKLISVIKKEKDLKNAIDEYNNTELKKFNDLGYGVYEKYAKKAAEYLANKYHHDEEEIDEILDMILYGDGYDDGTFADDPFYQYCKEKRLNFKDESDKYYDAHAKMLATAKKVTDEYLGKYGKKHMKNVKRNFNTETYLIKEITDYKYLRSGKDLYEILEWNETYDSKI